MKEDVVRTLGVPWAVAALAMVAPAPDGPGLTGAAALILATAWALHRPPIKTPEARPAPRPEPAPEPVPTPEPRDTPRQLRLRALAPILELQVGQRSAPATLVDLSLRDIRLTPPPGEAARWCRGMPVRVRVQVDGHREGLGWAYAQEAERSGEVWRLRWRDPLREHELSRALRDAILAREAHRATPHPDTRAWLRTPEGDQVAVVTDLSANGLGISLPIGPREAGDLPAALVIVLRLPEWRDPLELACRLVHLDVRGSGTSLGLALDPSSPGFAELQPRLASHVLRRDVRLGIRLVS